MKDITQEMITEANQEEIKLMFESPGVLMAQNNHLNQRVVLLKALVNEQAKEIERLTKLKRPSDRQPRKTVAPKKKP